MSRHVVSLAAAVVALSALAGAQIRYLPTAPGVWKPWVFHAYDDNRRLLAAKPADVKALDLNLQALGAILKKTPGFAAPVGFSVETAGDVQAEGWRPAQTVALTALPLPALFNFGAYGVYDSPRGRGDTGETSQLLFFVNQLGVPLYEQEAVVPEYVNLETDVALLARAQPDVFGMPRYGHSIVLKKSAAPIWAPVSLDEALTLAISDIERRLADRRDVATRLQRQRDDLTDPAQHAKRIADYKTAAALSKDANALAKLMKAEDQLQAQAATLAKPIADAQAQAAAVERELAAAKTAAAALPAADRAASACYAAQASGLARFQHQTSDRCVAIVRPNWKLFNPALPRSAPQLLVITHWEGCLLPQTLPHPGGCVANRKLLETLDRQALLDWLR